MTSITRNKPMKATPSALLALALALTACGPHIDTPHVPSDRDSTPAPVAQTKPAPPLRLPGEPAPGPVWQNPDGTYGAQK